jgi:sarcosine oxidase subunit alpha
MSETTQPRQKISVNGHVFIVPAGITVAAALSIAGHQVIRRSRSGEPRGALCGMGICHECRADINGVPHQRTCQVPCEDGMRINTDA